MSSSSVSCGEGAANFFRSDIVNQFGFHGARVKSYFFESDRDAIVWNLSVVLNMIPGIGSLLAGIYHIAKGLSSENTNLVLVGRGIAEILVGPVVALFDVVATAGRFITGCSSSMQEASERTPEVDN